jgi:proline dehydrogenase
VVDTLSVDLIEHYAQAEGVERKDVVNLVFHVYFARRDYLPQNAKGRGGTLISRRG